MDSYGEETPLFPYNGNPNPIFFSYPSGLVGQSHLLHDDYDPLERRVLPPAPPPPPPQADQPQPPPLKKRKTKRAPPSSSAAIPSAAPPPARAPAPAPAAPPPPPKKKNPSSAVTPQELAELRDHYDLSYPTWPRATRKAERERVAALVGVTPRTVSVGIPFQNL